MSEQPTQDQSEFSAASVQMPETLHIDLPEVNQGKVLFILCESLVLISKRDWKLIADGFVSCKAITTLGFFCMDIIQTFTEAIVDAVMPQVYRYMRTYGTFPSTIVDLNEDRIHSYLGDCIGQALHRILKTKVENFQSTKKFLELLVKNISKAINTVLVLTTETLIRKSGLPVFFVSGCVTSVTALKDMVSYLALILTKAVSSRLTPEQVKEDQLGSTTSPDSLEEEVPTIFFSIPDHVLKYLVKNYITRMVKVLKGKTQSPCSEINSSNDRNVCIRVGTNRKILTVEDTSESQGRSSCSGLDAIPGVAPNSTDAESPSEGFSSVKVMGKKQLNPETEMKLIKKITGKLVKTFMKNQQEAEKIDNFQKAVLGGLEDADFVKLKELTERIFDLIMNGQDYQIPLVPAGVRMCDTVTYSQLRRQIIPDAHALYMWTEEVATRCALLILLWAALMPDCCEFQPVQHSPRSEWRIRTYAVGDQKAAQARRYDDADSLQNHSSSPDFEQSDSSSAYSLLGSPNFSQDSLRVLTSHFPLLHNSHISVSCPSSFLNSPNSSHPSRLVLRPWTPPLPLSPNSDFSVSRIRTGAHSEGENRPASTSTYDVPTLTQEPRLSQLIGRAVEASLLAPLVRKMLSVIAIRNNNMIANVVQATLEHLEDLDPEMHHYFHGSLMGQSYEDISRRAMADLLKEFGSVQVMQEVVRSGDLRFNEAVIRALIKQLTMPTSEESATKKTDGGFFKKFKRLCCKKIFKKVSKTTTGIPLTTDKNDENLRVEEPIKEEKKECRRGFLSKTAASFRNIFSSIARTISKPFITCCCCPKST